MAYSSGCSGQKPWSQKISFFFFHLIDLEPDLLSALQPLLPRPQTQIVLTTFLPKSLLVPLSASSLTLIVCSGHGNQKHCFKMKIELCYSSAQALQWVPIRFRVKAKVFAENYETLDENLTAAPPSCLSDGKAHHSHPL